MFMYIHVCTTTHTHTHTHTVHLTLAELSSEHKAWCQPFINAMLKENTKSRTEYENAKN